MSERPAEAREARAPALLLDVLDALDDAVCVAGRDADGGPGSIMHANGRFCCLVGQSPEGLLGQPWARVVGPLIEAGSRDRATALVRDGRVEWATGSGDEADAWYEATLQPIECRDGWVTVIRDVTAARAVAERLRRQHDQLLVSQELAGLGTWEWDIRFDLVRWSDQLYKIFGLDSERFEATYAAYVDRIHPDDRAATAAHVEGCMNHQPFEADYRIVLDDGSVRWLHSRGRPEVDEHGKVIRLTGVCQDITARKELEDALMHRSVHDSLAGLANRFLLLDRMEHALSRARRQRHPIAVCFVDLDHFKRVNDESGHETGDEVLRKVASRLSSAVRSPDTVARVGGDEFVVLAEDADGHADAATVGQRLVEATRLVITSGEHEHCITSSVGVALSDDADVPTMLLFKADQAMYRAKRLGGDRCEMHASALSS